MKKQEQGIALISVLGLLTVVMVLVAAAVAVSQTQRFSTATITQLGDSVYLNESAMNRAIWLISHDRSLFPDRAIRPGKEQLVRRDRFQADGVPRLFDVGGTPVEVRILDMNAGLNLSGVNPVSGLAYWNQKLMMDGAGRRTLDVFRNRLMDYVDSDGLLRADGMEQADYEVLGFAPLPRNSAMQFREEVLWVPGGEEFVRPEADGLLSMVNPIPPRGLQFQVGNPHFFSASPALIQDKCGFADRELTTVGVCRDRIASREVGADEAFGHEPLLYERLKKQFSLTESAFYALHIHVSPESGLPGRKLIAALRIDSSPGDNGIVFYQYLYY